MQFALSLALHVVLCCTILAVNVVLLRKGLQDEVLLKKLLEVHGKYCWTWFREISFADECMHGGLSQF
jgi:hypothetical protein